MKALAIWLVLIAVFLGLFQCQQKKLLAVDLIQAKEPMVRMQVVHDDGLAYLNYLRTQAGLQKLVQSTQLKSSALNHARYLLEYPDDGHDEHQKNSTLFTGKDVTERSKRVGYLYRGVQENVSISNRSQNENISADFASQQQIDGLMTAIYHRFSLLDQNIDEAGLALLNRDQRMALVVNQGNSKHNRLCALSRLNPEIGKRYYQNICHNQAIIYEAEAQIHRPLLYVVYPIGASAMPDFHGEQPDPMPNHSLTGNPVSIDFTPEAGQIEMYSFKLYQGDTEITPVRILTKYNDSNHKLTDKQFALFPINPLSYDTEYRAVFDYKRNGKKEQAQWHFRTKRPDYPYFMVNGGEKLAVRANQKYFIHWVNRWCLKDCSKLIYQQRGGAKLEILERQAGGIIVQVQGVGLSNVQIMFENEPKQAITLYLQDT